MLANISAISSASEKEPLIKVQRNFFIASDFRLYVYLNKRRKKVNRRFLKVKALSFWESAFVLRKLIRDEMPSPAFRAALVRYYHP